ncbi:hypothetical protein [Aliarcobacter cryaerophilus]|uniref:hypothetical protein n=1 Tax=Aliarcobacter cryaerophilus TaxID=28198 RepID=UPI003BAEDEC0
MYKKEIKQNNKIEIKYEDSFVAFLDILGFTNFVRNNEIDKINTYLEQVERMISIIKEKLLFLRYIKEINFIVISDSIIISIQKNDTKNIEILKILCTAIYSIQGYLASCDIWLRGAISSGESYFNYERNQIIGNAYINAYILENKFVSNPQVIIDNKIIQELGFTNSRDFIKKINYDTNNINLLYDWNNTSYIKKDFPLFINYLDHFFYNINSKNNTRKINLIESIIKNIEKNIYSNTSLYSKYKWVTNYALSLIDNSQNNEFNKFKERLEKL